jgi:N-acetylglucosaminyldiphosphoundecaprenol N-acetyl-beta-D-mannosaminyltransferase
MGPEFAGQANSSRGRGLASSRAMTAAVSRPVTEEPRALRLMGVRVTDVGFDTAVASLAAGLDHPQRRALFFVNAHTLNLAARDPAFRETLNRADVVFGDGTGVRWGARSRGLRLRANLNGTDLTPALLDARPGTRVFLLGSTAERIGRAAEAFRARFPHCELAGFHHGYVQGEVESRAAVAMINAARPDVLLVGMGNPLQERWIDRWRGELDARLCIGVGGLLEYWTGALDRAPGWMRRAGVEWVHIMLRQPWKAGRYLAGNPAFLARLLLWLPADLKRSPALG